MARSVTSGERLALWKRCFRLHVFGSCCGLLPNTIPRGDDRLVSLALHLLLSFCRFRSVGDQVELNLCNQLFSAGCCVGGSSLLYLLRACNGGMYALLLTKYVAFGCREVRFLLWLLL